MDCPSQKSHVFDLEAVDRHTMISDRMMGSKIQVGPPFSSRIFLRCSSTVVKATLPKFTPMKRHPAGRNIYDVEVESAKEEESEGEEDEVTLEDPVQEESDVQSESHVIEAFLTSGHTRKPQSCGNDQREPARPVVAIVSTTMILVRRRASVQLAVNWDISVEIVFATETRTLSSPRPMGQTSQCRTVSCSLG